MLNPFDWCQWRLIINIFNYLRCEPCWYNIGGRVVVFNVWKDQFSLLKVISIRKRNCSKKWRLHDKAKLLCRYLRYLRFVLNNNLFKISHNRLSDYALLLVFPVCLLEPDRYVRTSNSFRNLHLNTHLSVFNWYFVLHLWWKNKGRSYMDGLGRNSKLHSHQPGGSKFRVDACILIFWHFSSITWTSSFLSFFFRNKSFLNR